MRKRAAPAKNLSSAELMPPPQAAMVPLPPVTASDFHHLALCEQARLVTKLQQLVLQEMLKMAKMGHMECALWMDSLLESADSKAVPIEVANQLSSHFGKLGFSSKVTTEEKRRLGTEWATPKLTLSWREAARHT